MDSKGGKARSFDISSNDCPQFLFHGGSAVPDCERESYNSIDSIAAAIKNSAKPFFS